MKKIISITWFNVREIDVDINGLNYTKFTIIHNYYK